MNAHTRTALSSILALFLVPSASVLSAQEQVQQDTIITSEHLEMQGTEEKNYFYFSGSVEVKGTNLYLSCNELTVVSLREGPTGATIGSIGALEKIVASGAVVIEQAGRMAYAGRAEVDPHAGTVVLSESPRIIDDEVAVEGYQFVLNKGEKKFVSVPDPNAPAEEPSRSVVRLGAMPDLGFDQAEEQITVGDQLGKENGEGDDAAP
jgi:lipopolysaccharide export system protein LptA